MQMTPDCQCISQSPRPCWPLPRIIMGDDEAALLRLWREKRGLKLASTQKAATLYISFAERFARIIGVPAHVIARFAPLHNEGSRSNQLLEPLECLEGLATED